MKKGLRILFVSVLTLAAVSVSHLTSVEFENPIWVGEPVYASDLVSEELEKELNSFIQLYLVEVDESVRPKYDKIKGFFDSPSNQNYLNAIDEVMDPAYTNFFTTGTPVKNVRVQGNQIQFRTYFTREVRTSSGGINYVYGERDWNVMKSGDTFKIVSYQTKILDAPYTDSGSSEMNLEEILKGDYSSVAGKWTNEYNKSSSVEISSDGMMDRTGHLNGSREFSGSQLVETGDVVAALSTNRSHVGKSVNVLFVPKGEGFLPEGVAGLNPKSDRDRIILMEDLEGSKLGYFYILYKQ